MRVPGKRLLSRAALIRSVSCWLPVVSSRFCRRSVLFSALILSTASAGRSISRSRMRPRSLPIWSRWLLISAYAALRASSALSARSFQGPPCPASWRRKAVAAAG